MKKFLLLLMSSLIILSGCTFSETGEQSTDKKTVTVTTSFLNDIVKQLAGELVNIQVVIPAGEDPHQYVAKVSDVNKLFNADLILYHGLHFEGKMVEALESSGVAVTKDFTKDQLQDYLDANADTVVDPHFWFNINLYKQAVKTTSLQLQELIPEHTQTIQQNTQTYLQQLDELNTYIIEKLGKIPENQRIVITPHDAFNYFASAYNVKLYAPQGISTTSEVDNAAMIETVNLIIDNHIKAIFTESTTNPERMEKLKEAVNARGGTVEVVSGNGNELFSDSLAPEGENGDNYIDMYKHNIELIVSHLQ